MDVMTHAKEIADPRGMFGVRAIGRGTYSIAAPRKIGHRSYAAALNRQRQDLDVPDRDELTCLVELERRDVAGFCLNRQTDCLAAVADWRTAPTSARATPRRLTPAGGHDIPAAINSPGHRQGARSFPRAPSPGDQSAHLPAATFEPSLPDSGPVNSY